MKNIILTLLLCFLFLGNVHAQPTFTDISKLVSILTIDPDGTQAEGSGLFISEEGHILTNKHVVENADIISVCTNITVKSLCFYVDVISSNAKPDLALLAPSKTLTIEPPFFEIRDPELDLEFGEDIWVMGYPNYANTRLALTKGINSGYFFPDGANLENARTYHMTDAKMTAGNSGGPVFDDSTRLVGVSNAIGLGAQENIGIFISSYAILQWFNKIGFDNYTVASDVVREPITTADNNKVEAVLDYIGSVFRTLPVKERLGLQEVYAILTR